MRQERLEEVRAVLMEMRGIDACRSGALTLVARDGVPRTCIQFNGDQLALIGEALRRMERSLTRRKR